MSLIFVARIFFSSATDVIQEMKDCCCASSTRLIQSLSCDLLGLLRRMDFEALILAL